MAIAHDVEVASAVNTGSVSEFTENLNGVSSSCIGYVVGVWQASADRKSSRVTINGRKLQWFEPANDEGRPIDSAGEPGSWDIYWITGRDLPTGNVVVRVTRTNDATHMSCIAFSVTAGAGELMMIHPPTQVQEADAGADAALSTVNVTDNSPGQNSEAYSLGYTAAASLSAAASNTLEVAQNNVGSGISYGLARRTTPAQGSRAVGFSSASDDYCQIGFTVRILSNHFVGTTWYWSAFPTSHLRGPYWISQNKGVIFAAAGWWDNANSGPGANDGDMGAFWTEDGGKTWERHIFEAGQVEGINACFDGEVPGNTGTHAYAVWTATGTNELKTCDYDIETGTFAAPVQIVALGGTYNCPWILKTRSGNFIAGAANGSAAVCRTWDPINGWIAAGTDPFEAGVHDDVLGMAAMTADPDDGAILFYDRSANQITLKVYDWSAGTWSENVTGAPTAARGSGDIAVMDFAVDPTTGQIFFCYWTGIDDAAADLHVATITPNSTANNGCTYDTTTYANAETNLDNAGSCGIFRNPNNGRMFVNFYLAATGFGTDNLLYYREFTSSWQARTLYQAGEGGNFRITTGGAMRVGHGGIYAPTIWHRDEKRVHINHDNMIVWNHEPPAGDDVELVVLEAERIARAASLKLTMEALSEPFIPGGLTGLERTVTPVSLDLTSQVPHADEDEATWQLHPVLNLKPSPETEVAAAQGEYPIHGGARQGNVFLVSMDLTSITPDSENESVWPLVLEKLRELAPRDLSAVSSEDHGFPHIEAVLGVRTLGVALDLTSILPPDTDEDLGEYIRLLYLVPVVPAEHYDAAGQTADPLPGFMHRQIGPVLIDLTSIPPLPDPNEQSGDLAIALLQLTYPKPADPVDTASDTPDLPVPGFVTRPTFLVSLDLTSILPPLTDEQSNDLAYARGLIELPEADPAATDLFLPPVAILGIERTVTVSIDLTSILPPDTDEDLGDFIRTLEGRRALEREFDQGLHEALELGWQPPSGPVAPETYIRELAVALSVAFWDVVQMDTQVYFPGYGTFTIDLPTEEHEFNWHIIQPDSYDGEAGDPSGGQPLI